MKLLILILLAITLMSCQAGQAARVGERLQELESAACPLSIAKTFDDTLANVTALVPLIVWHKICPEDEDEQN